MIKWELRRNLVSLIIWISACSLLICMGLIELSSFDDFTEMNELIGSFPPIVRVVFGISVVDLSTFAGYYSILNYYIAIAIMVYACNAGFKIARGEEIDKTADFLLTKPISRTKIALNKLLSYVILLSCLILFTSLIGLLLSIALDFKDTYTIFVFALGNISMGIFAMAFSTLLALLVPKRKMTTTVILLVNIFLVIIYDMLGDNNIFLQLITPLKWFCPIAVSNGEVPYMFTLWGIMLASIASFGFIKLYLKRDIVN